MPVERRACPRANILADCYGMILVDVPSLHTTGLLMDLSESGMGVQFAVPIPAVARIDVDFPLDERRITSTCDSVWSTASTWGLRFRGLSQEDQAWIRSWLHSTSGIAPPVADPNQSDTAPRQPDEARPIWQEIVDTLPPAKGHVDSAACTNNDATGSTPPDIALPPGLSAGKEMEQTAGCNADLAGTTPPIRAGAWSRELRSKQAQPEWAIRIAGRHQQQARERLRIWREHESTHSLPPPLAGRVANPTVAGEQHGSGLLAENTRALAAADIAISGSDSESVTGEIRRSFAAELTSKTASRNHSRAVGWSITLIIALVAGGSLLWLHLNARNTMPRTNDQAGLVLPSSGAGQRISQRPRMIGVVEIVEGRAIAHSHARSAGEQSTITPGTIIVRELPTYDDRALASGTEGDVHAVITITERGIVQNVQVIEKDSVFAREVINAAAHWRYTPYIDDSGPASVELPMIFKFHLVAASAVKTRNAEPTN